MITNTFNSLKEYKTKSNKIAREKQARTEQIVKRCFVGGVLGMALTCCVCGFAFHNNNRTDVRMTAGIATIMK